MSCASMIVQRARNWTEYNKHVRDWIAQLLKVPGAVSFMGYRTADGSSPNTITMLEFRTVEEARRARVLELHRWATFLADEDGQGGWLWDCAASAAGARGRSRTG